MIKTAEKFSVTQETTIQSLRRAPSNFGYEYKISKTDAPWSDTYKVVYQSDGQINRPVSYTFTIGDENWKFEVAPKSGWRNATLLIIIIGIFLTISLLLSVLTRVWLVAKEHKKKFQILARTDSLTNIYNRYGFDEFAEKMIQKREYPKVCVNLQTDVR